MFHKLLLRVCLTLLIAELSLVKIVKTGTVEVTATRAIPVPATTIARVELRSGLTTKSPTNPNTATSQSSVDSNTTRASSTYTTNNNTPNAPTNATATSGDISSSVYCMPTLCELYNGSHVLQVPHIGCNNNGTFAPACGAKPHLLYMSQRRRQFILDMHNLARERIASGQLEGYRAAAHMPMLKWDDELEYMASLHVKRCQFAHDQCRNTPRYQFSGQNIGYFWIGREFKSHAKRFKSFILDWFREYRLANQSFIDQYRPHPEGKKIGHFTMLVADRAHRVGCAAIRYRDPSDINYMKLLMTCNYDYTNILGEPVYQSGLAASKCIYKISEKYPSLCDWKDAVYDYSSEESVEEDNGNELDSNFIN